MATVTTGVLSDFYLARFNVSKINVLEEVAEQTSYDGKKSDTYDQLFTTDADRFLLARFWNEACNNVTDAFKEYLSSVSNQGVEHGIDLENDYYVVAALPLNWDSKQADNIESTLFSYFVNYIIARWYDTVNKEGVAAYSDRAVALITNAANLLYHRKRPTR